MKVGYARVSTGEQNLALQVDALRRAGCEKVLSDQGISGADFSRPGLDAALARLSAGDTLVVWRLDRLGRSLARLVDLITWLGDRSIQFMSLTESINTTSPGGVLVFHMMAALAEFERSLISERTRAGMTAARERGRIPGRRRSLNSAQCEEARALLLRSPIVDVAQHFNVHPRTLKRALDAESSAAQSNTSRRRVRSERDRHSNKESTNIESE
jgi:DNA invertase Pin-like site-specific DNA recombinase